MAPKVYRSTLTWRTLEDQDVVLAPVVPGWPNVPVYTDEYDLQQLLRPTTRRVIDDLYMASLAVLAKNEDIFKTRMSALLKRFTIIVVEDEWNGRGGSAALKAWKLARRKDFGKHGGETSAKKKKAEVENRAKGLTKEEWTNGSIKNAKLVEKYDVSLNALKRIAHVKGWGQDRQQAIWRQEALQRRRDKRNGKI